jgi:toxin FitB
VIGSNVVDSSGWLEYLKGSERASFYAAAIEDSESLIVPVISIYEVYKKFLREKNENDALEAIGTMLNGLIVDVDLALCLEAAKLRLPLADSLVYATAQRFGATVWTQDVDFEGLPNVKYFAK